MNSFVPTSLWVNTLSTTLFTKKCGSVLLPLGLEEMKGASVHRTCTRCACCRPKCPQQYYTNHGIRSGGITTAVSISPKQRGIKVATKAANKPYKLHTEVPMLMVRLATSFAVTVYPWSSMNLRNGWTCIFGCSAPSCMRITWVKHAQLHSADRRPCMYHAQAVGKANLAVLDPPPPSPAPCGTFHLPFAPAFPAFLHSVSLNVGVSYYSCCDVHGGRFEIACPLCLAMPILSLALCAK